MIRAEQFRNKHAGQTCAVLGGGTTLPYDLRAIPQVDVLIGVNQHSNILPVDYIVFSDREMWDFVKNVDGCYKVTHLDKFRDRSDVILMESAPHIGFSGAKAIWFADYLGFEKTYVCGMDQYEANDDREYWWQGPQSWPFKAKHHQARSDMERWKEFIKRLQFPERVYFVSGRLKEIHQ